MLKIEQEGLPDHACDGARADVFDCLMQAGAFVQGAAREFPELHRCARNGFAHGIKGLIAAGADVAAKDAQGRTALEWWCRSAGDRAGDHNYGEIAAQLGGVSVAKAHVQTLDASKRLTKILWHPVCLEHHSCRPSALTDRNQIAERPSENVNRVRVLVDPELGILNAATLKDRVSWSKAPRARLVDVLRVHDYSYVSKLRDFCESIPDDKVSTAQIDGDTTVSHKTFEAAMTAAGSVCKGVDMLLQDDPDAPRNVFCATRPPGHHAGPRGKVVCESDPLGSFGFCLLSNAAIGAAYARCVYRHKGISKVAIIDFDVHHGNGTEECVRNLSPNVVTSSTGAGIGDMGVCEVRTVSEHCKPWLDEADEDNVFFASIHGWGARMPGVNADVLKSSHSISRFYPSSGDTAGLNADEPARIVNVGQNSTDRIEWRKSWLTGVLPALRRFNPDMIFISAGFDAHAEDEINFGYVSALEEDYAWLTERLVRIANSCCKGRIVSVLEGGYRIQGKIVSPFARSVYAHVDALARTSSQECWDDTEAAWEASYVPPSADKEEGEGEAAAASGDSVQAAPVLETAARPSRRPRRKRASVDYVALNKKLDEERASKKAKSEQQESGGV